MNCGLPERRAGIGLLLLKYCWEPGADARCLTLDEAAILSRAAQFREAVGKSLK
jgi:hypothetical protein